MTDFLKRLFARTRGSDTTPDCQPSAMADAHEHRLLIFDHIPKTAGTTFRRSYLIAAFARDQRWILSGGEKNAEDIERFLKLPPERRRRFRIVAGHNADTLRKRVPGARFVTVVRDPVDRVVSAYLHALFHVGGEALWPDVREQQMGLKEFVQKYEAPNSQSVQLLGPGTFAEREIREILRSRYALVGYTEAFDQFVFMLHASEQFPLCLYNNRLVRQERHSYVPSDADLAFVRDLNAQDVLLHRVVRSEFQQRVDELPSNSRVRLERFLQLLEQFRVATHGDPSQSMRLEESAFSPDAENAASSHGAF